MTFRSVAAMVLFASAACGGSSQVDERVPSLLRLQDLAQYVGDHPCKSGLLGAPVLERALRDTLAADYAAFQEHVSLSGCGAIERRNGSA